ncbi:MAG: NADH-quinone oxidoreductase subunit N, partial [Acidobacteria bacterium]|nr:NADH-quinone oxidoreductase subunit N [Acidobacteriota bacterium]
LAKFYVINAAVEARSYWLAIVAMLSAVVSAFLYLRVVVAMYMNEPGAAADADGRLQIPAGAGIALALAVAFTLVVGVVPDRVAHWADRAVPVLTDKAG